MPAGPPLGQAATTQLITRPADSTLHPARCRRPDPGQPASRGRKGRSCGARLDQSGGPGPPRPSTSMLKTQRRLLDLLGPGHPAEEAASRFTDLRVVTALLCTTWPSGRDPGLRSSTGTSPHARRTCGKRPHPSPAPTGASASEEPKRPSAPTATAPSTSPRSWNNTGTRSTSHRFRPAPAPSPCVVSEPSSSSSRQRAAQWATLQTSWGSTPQEASTQ